MPTWRIVGVHAIPESVANSDDHPPLVAAYEHATAMKSLQNNLADSSRNPPVDLAEIEDDLLGFETVQETKGAAMATLFAVVKALLPWYLRSNTPVYKPSSTGTHHNSRVWAMLNENSYDPSNAVQCQVTLQNGSSVNSRVIIEMIVHEL